MTKSRPIMSMAAAVSATIPFANATGYGSPTLVVTGCDVEGAACGTCQAESRDIRQITGGFCHNFYKGSYGRLVARAQVSYTERDAFRGAFGIGPLQPPRHRPDLPALLPVLSLVAGSSDRTWIASEATPPTFMKPVLERGDKSFCRQNPARRVIYEIV